MGKTYKNVYKTSDEDLRGIGKAMAGILTHPERTTEQMLACVEAWEQFWAGQDLSVETLRELKAAFETLYEEPIRLSFNLHFTNPHGTDKTEIIDKILYDAGIDMLDYEPDAEFPWTADKFIYQKLSDKIRKMKPRGLKDIAA